MIAESCPMADCEGRLSVLEASLAEAKRVADKAAEDVKRIERDVDLIGSEMRRLRAVMVGSDEEENGGLRAEVQGLRVMMAESRKAQRVMTWMLAALIAVLSPDQLIRLAPLIQKVVSP